MTKNTPRLSTSSTSIKLFCLGIFLLLYLNLNASSIILHKSRNFISDDYDYDAPSRVDYKPRSTSVRAVSSKAQDYDKQQNIDTIETAVNTAEKVDTTSTPNEDEDDQKITNHYGQSTYSKNDMYKMIQDSKDCIAKRGKIAWLMSFPNSGTSFTSLLIRYASNTTCATNYGMESHIGKTTGNSVPVYNWSKDGPYWIHPPDMVDTATTSADVKEEEEKKNDYTVTSKVSKAGVYSLPPSTASILTKTHCGSRCVFCPPQRYIESDISFLIECLSGAKRVTEGKSYNTKKAKYKKEYVSYHPSVVEKAIHLIRNPFDNLISRFHHEQKEHKKRVTSGQKDKQGLTASAWVERYSNDVPGFKKWCMDEDRLFHEAEKQMDWNKFDYPEDITKSFVGVSCHAEFVRYVAWHVLTIQSINLLDIPVLHVHYEDYSTNLEKSTDTMLDFLNLERKGKLPYFDSNKNYSQYFTNEERASASDLMKRLVNAKDDSGLGIKLLERYWVSHDFDKLRDQTLDST